MRVRRHSKILELINNEQIHTQSELADRLNELGFNVTQATVSRDIRQLHLTKISANSNKSYYSIASDIDLVKKEKYIRVLRDGFYSADLAMNIVVIKTVEGMAMAVAAALDHIDIKEIVGCLAGDDTLFCATKSPEDAIVVINKIDTMLKSGRNNA